MSTHLLDDTNTEAWDNFVENCPDATFFHKAGWKSVIEESFGQKAYFLYAKEENEITGVLPLIHSKSALFNNALISNAFCVSGGPATTNEAARDSLIDAAINLLPQSGAKHIELRDTQIEGPSWQQKNDLYANFSWVTATDEDENLKQIPRKQRAVVRKALKNESLMMTLDESVDDFYQLYAFSLRNLGTPVFSKRYAENLVKVFGDQVEILTIRHQGKAVSSVMSFYFRDQVLPYYTGSTLEARKLGSNDLMYWRVMRRGVERGATTFDFGRSKIGTGPYSFKKNWGFEPRPMPQSFWLEPGEEMPNLNPTNPKYQLFIKAWQSLPLPVANFMGPYLFRNLG